MRFTFDFEELDYPLPGGWWLPHCLSGSADILVDGDCETWGVESCQIIVCGVDPKGGRYTANIKNMSRPWGITYDPFVCSDLEAAIKRSRSHLSALQDEIIERSCEGREFEKEVV